HLHPAAGVRRLLPPRSPGVQCEVPAKVGVGARNPVRIRADRRHPLSRGGKRAALMLTTHGLEKRYGDHFALRDVDIEVEEGSVYGLVGPNGSGKTTLLSIVAGL